MGKCGHIPGNLSRYSLVIYSGYEIKEKLCNIFMRKIMEDKYIPSTDAMDVFLHKTLKDISKFDPTTGMSMIATLYVRVVLLGLSCNPAHSSYLLKKIDDFHTEVGQLLITELPGILEE